MKADDIDDASESAYAPTEAMSLEELFGIQRQEQLASEPVPTSPANEPATPVATFMYARVYHLTEACESLSGSAASTLVSEVRRALAAAATKLGGEIAQRRADSILCVFTNPPDEAPTHAQRALHAAIATVQQIG